MYRRIPVTDQFIIEPQQGNRTARHFKGSDIASYEGTSNGNILATQNSGEFVGNDIEFDQRGPTHAIDKGQHTFTSFQAKVIDDGDGKHFCHFSGGRELNTTAARFAMNANANLHLVITDFKGRLASRRNGAGSKSHTHTATLAVHLLRQGSHLFQGGTRLSQATHDFLEQYGNKNAVHRFMTTATARDDPYFATHRSILAHYHLVLVIDTDQFRVQGPHASKCLFYHVL